MSSLIHEAPRINLDVIDSPEGIEQFSNLLDECFKLSPGRHYFDDFPVWNPVFGAAEAIRMGAFSDGELRSCLAARLVELKTFQGGSIPLCLVGAVATHPQWRGMGLATHLVRLAHAWAEERKACAVILWGSEHRFYEKLGFGLFGEQIRISLSSIVGLDQVSELEIFEGWNPNIFHLIQKRKNGLILQNEDLSWYGAHKNVLWYYIGSEKKPAAYAALGRGIDLPGAVHEWGGDPKLLSALLKHICKLHPDSYILGSRNGLREVGLDPRLGASEFLCLAKIFSDQVKSIESSFWIWGLDGA